MHGAASVNSIPISKYEEIGWEYEYWNVTYDTVASGDLPSGTGGIGIPKTMCLHTPDFLFDSVL